MILAQRQNLKWLPALETMSTNVSSLYQSPKCDWALRSETQVREGDKKDPSGTIRTQKIIYTKKVVVKAKNRISKTHL